MLCLQARGALVLRSTGLVINDQRVSAIFRFRQQVYLSLKEADLVAQAVSFRYAPALAPRLAVSAKGHGNHERNLCAQTRKTLNLTGDVACKPPIKGAIQTLAHISLNAIAARDGVNCFRIRNNKATHRLRAHNSQLPNTMKS